ncbi:hypothetical protein M9Y10_036452 [Tritrichomonas musculus]|uniref:Protein kinase domain-containing protein n=1 Tax=Tritrichomonas musculus TaxID=1915356 RepID=A0ABR2GW40_9EUKA
MAEIVDEFTNLFVEADNFEENYQDNLLADNGNDASKFVQANEVETKEKVICKVFNPEPLKENAIDSNDKKDQCWYKQLLLMREAIFLKELRHPAIVDIKGINLYNSSITFKDDDDDDDEEEEEGIEKPLNTSPTIFLEFLENKSLQNLINKKIELTPLQRQIIMIGLSAGVRFLHSKNILHRSLNPLTIWLDSNYYPKIFDFSTSREANPQNDISKTSLKADSVYYQAPEIADPTNKDYNTPIDIYSLARLLYLMITQHEPFKHPDDKLKSNGPYYIQDQYLNHGAFPYFPDDVPEKLKQLLIKCWDLNPSNRPIAEEVFYYISQSSNYYIKGIKDEDIPIIDKYVKEIQEYENAHNHAKLKIVETYSLNIPITLQDPTPADAIPTKPSQQIQMLARITSSNFAYSNEDTTLRLLIKMAENESILQDDNLLNVSNFINSLNARNCKLAEEFLNKIYGTYIITSRNEKIIKQDTVTDKSIKVVNIPPWVEKIGSRAFLGFKNLERVNIPNSVIEIGQEAFSGCEKLKIVNIPESLIGNKLGKSAFKGCTSLKYVKLPSNLTKIEESTFKDDKSLAYVTLNHGLEIIGKLAFDECKSLESIVIPNTVTLISEKAFHHCKLLKTVFFKGSKPVIEKKAIGWKVKKETI